MNKLSSIEYIIANNPVCADCARGNLEQVRIAAGLYQLVKDILADRREQYTPGELDDLIRQATKF